MSGAGEEAPEVRRLAAVGARVGEDVTLDAPVSPRLLEGASRAAEIFGEWWGYRVPGIVAAGGTAPAAAGSGLRE